jgi:small subunit ribosomal protein S9
VDKQMVTKSPTIKPAAAKAPRKPRATAKKTEAQEVKAEAKHEPKAHAEHTPKAHKALGKYIFATGRRKTSVANVRLFEGNGQHLVNKKPFETYFSYSFYQDKALKPFDVTGLAKDFHVVANVSGGGAHSQAEALSHGVARALSTISDEVKMVLKKNGLLTRDDRVKERKKPGLKRARRAPQWAKR